jgi:sugar O-acyltransferase (sialic acid O-acetyltransferase NeuD family)
VVKQVVVGTGGMGREVAAWLDDAGEGENLLGFVDDRPEVQGTEVVGLPVLGDLDWLRTRPEVRAVLGVGAPAARARIVSRLDAWGVSLGGVVHPTAMVGPRTRLADGAIVCPRVLLSCDVQLGRGAIVNYGAMLGHDCVVGEYAFVAPGCHVAGTVTLGPRVDLGIGASVLQGITIGADAVVGAGAVVIRDVAPGTTVVGVPARPLTKGR